MREFEVGEENKGDVAEIIGRFDIAKQDRIKSHVSQKVLPLRDIRDLGERISHAKNAASHSFPIQSGFTYNILNLSD